MKLRPFELALVVIFFGLAVLSLILLSTFQSRSSKDGELVIGQVQIWGMMDSGKMFDLLADLSETNDAYVDVTYQYVAPDRFASELTSAIADGNGPDIVLISNEELVSLRKRISPISYDSFPVRDIKSVYVDGASVFALSDGLYAYPLAVDPLMLFWNKDMLTNKNFLEAPKTWESLVNSYTPNLTERDFERTITKSTVAMGEYGNINNAFAIISALLLQSGSKGVMDENGSYVISLNESVNGGKPLTTTTDFYTRFSRPNNTLYSWNRSFERDRQQFLSEDLALYFGFGSEAREIERQNPNLNFDIAEIPQGATATIRRTYGKFYGLSLIKNSDNITGAAAVMATLASPQYAERIALENNLTPVLRDTIGRGSNDTYGRLTYRSAAIAYGWLNPARPAVDTIFTTMIRDVTEGRFDESQAANDALGRLELEYN